MTENRNRISQAYNEKVAELVFLGVQQFPALLRTAIAKINYFVPYIKTFKKAI